MIINVTNKNIVVSEKDEIQKLTMIEAIYFMHQNGLESIRVFRGNNWKTYFFDEAGLLYFKEESGYQARSVITNSKQKFECVVPKNCYKIISE